MSDKCFWCGGTDFWFDREVTKRGSMHYVCDSCGATQPCGQDDCPYNDGWWVKVDEEDDDENL